MLRLSLINSSQDSLSLHNNIKSLETSRYGGGGGGGGWLRFHPKKSFELAPTLDRQREKLFIHLLTHSFVRSFVRSFIHFSLLTHSLPPGSVMPAGIHSYSKNQ